MMIITALTVLCCRKSQAEWCIKTAAKIISPAVEANYSAGYDWSVYYIIMYIVKVPKRLC